METVGSAASWTLGCVLGFQHETTKLTVRLNIFGEGRGCSIIVQLVHAASIKGEAELENTLFKGTKEKLVVGRRSLEGHYTASQCWWMSACCPVGY